MFVAEILIKDQKVQLQNRRSSRPKRIGSGQFKWKGPRRARVHLSKSRALADRSERTKRL